MAYEGFSNRETWQAALWLDNDRALNQAVRELMTTYTTPMGKSLSIVWRIDQTYS